MTIYKLISFIFISSFFFSLIFFFRSKLKFNRHKHNVKKANEILLKINSFEHSAQMLNYLRKIDPFIFEELLLTCFKNKGYKIKRNKRYTGDGGVDGIVYAKNGNKYLVQAKRYSKLINPQHLKDFILLASKNEAKGFFIHTGRTSENSFKIAQGSNVIIVSGEKLINLIKQK